MKRFSIEALALAALLTTCGSDADRSCKDGEYLVNEGLSCCPVGTEFKAGLCVKPVQTANPTTQETQTPVGTSGGQETSTLNTQPTAVEPPLLTPNGTWLFDYVTTSDSCSSENIGAKAQRSKGVRSYDGSRIGLDFQIDPPMPGCTPIQVAQELSGTLTETGNFRATGQWTYDCPAVIGGKGFDRFGTTVVYIGTLGNNMMSGASRIDVLIYPQKGIGAACSITESFTATKSSETGSRRYEGGKPARPSATRRDGAVETT